jgi:hypothetical protein
MHGTADPTNEEWQDFIKLVQHHGIDCTMHLVFTDGGGPRAPQRRYLSDVLAGCFVPVAVVSSSMCIRLTVTFLSWFNRGIKYFPPAKLREAIAYLEIPSSRVELVERHVATLRRELGAPTP